ncbi:hypothetical protein [Desulfitobacterium sp. AusDCA]|uniref:hypothetical protein n=1 Tax=Desulfitobacterium sp. AusDCA TaxID=3240383 RepID=UPI003DA78F30
MEEHVYSRDAQCAIIFGQLSELGCFEEEFTCFGTTYLERGIHKYFVSSEAENVYSFIKNSYIQGIYPTPVTKYHKRCQVPSGKRDDFRQEFKLQLAQQMRKMYSLTYFEVLDRLARQPANNNAYPLLSKIQEQLEGCFDNDALQLFEGLIQMAFEAKVLDLRNYSLLQNWLRNEHKQMEDDLVIHDVFERTFYGFAYQKEDGQIKYYYNALPLLTYEWRNNLICNNIFPASIFKKRYCFRRMMDFDQIKQTFQDELVERFDTDYFVLVKHIKAFPSMIKRVDFNREFKRIEEEGTREEIQALTYYGNLWNVI